MAASVEYHAATVRLTAQPKVEGEMTGPQLDVYLNKQAAGGWRIKANNFMGLDVGTVMLYFLFERVTA